MIDIASKMTNLLTTLCLTSLQHQNFGVAFDKALKVSKVSGANEVGQVSQPVLGQQAAAVGGPVPTNLTVSKQFKVWYPNGRSSSKDR